jgi:hypothetical protein
MYASSDASAAMPAGDVLPLAPLRYVAYSREAPDAENFSTNPFHELP